MIRKYRMPIQNKGYTETVKIPQYDTNYMLVFEMTNLPEGTTSLESLTATLEGLRADGLKYEYTGVITGATVSFEIDTRMTAAPGNGEARIVFTYATTEEVYASANFLTFIEASPVPDDAIDADTEEARSIAEEIQEIVDTAAGTVTQSIAPEYDPTLTYAVGAMVLYENELYRCTSAIATPEAWTQGHWTRTTVAQEETQIKEDLSDMNTATSADVGKALKVKTVTDGKVAEWEFGDAGGATVELDDTLTSPTKAAQAKAVGDAFNEMPYSVYHADRVTNGIYLNANGAEQTQNGWSVSEFLKIGETATYYMPVGIASKNVKSCYYDSSKAFVSAFKTGVTGINTLVAPSSAKYVRFSIPTSDVDRFTYTSTLFMPDKTGVVKPNHIDDCVLSRTVVNELTYGKFYTTTGGVGSNTSWAMSDLLPVSEGDVIYIQKAAHQCITYFDASGTFVGVVGATAGVGTDVTAVVPSGVAFVGLNVLKTLIDEYACYLNGQPIIAKYTLKWLDYNSIWTGKTYISHGDSITWQDGNAWGSGSEQGKIAKGYQSIFNKKVGLKSYNNQGKSGWSMAVVNSNGVVNTILSIADYTQYDLCTIACGTNDFKLNVPLGTLGVIGDTTFDDTTFYGAFRKAVEYILTNSPTIRLVLMTPLQRDNSGYDVNYTNSAGHKLIDYVNAVRALGDMYGLPVCDMYANSGFTKKTLSTYTLDGLHPNSSGYVRMGNYLTGFLNAIGN